MQSKSYNLKLIDQAARVGEGPLGGFDSKSVFDGKLVANSKPPAYHTLQIMFMRFKLTNYYAKCMMLKANNINIYILTKACILLTIYICLYTLSFAIKT